ncbi:MAG: VIT1/CCC1 transporter family protein, partial [Sedimentisphaerales bacterium]|nr:VIT1/CCC1 transporter family protein [Sedimentisphaerales bacterium]
KISEEELHHYHVLKKYSGKDLKPSVFRGWFYITVSAIFGVTFGIKLMEKGEDNAQVSYAEILIAVPEVGEILKEESEHENQLINMINEEKLKYMGSMVLGLNDALVEFTGALAGFTFALQNSRLIGTMGLIMGLSACLSMAASEYLSTKTEAEDRNPFKAAFYTGLAYILTVIVLVFPYFLFQDHHLSLSVTLGMAVLLVLIFTFYFAVVKDFPFRRRFIEMFTVSMSVAAISFVIGLAVRKFMHVDA